MEIWEEIGISREAYDILSDGGRIDYSIKPADPGPTDSELCAMHIEYWADTLAKLDDDAKLTSDDIAEIMSVYNDMDIIYDEDLDTFNRMLEPGSYLDNIEVMMGIDAGKDLYSRRKLLDQIGYNIAGREGRDWYQVKYDHFVDCVPTNIERTRAKSINLKAEPRYAATSEPSQEIEKSGVKTNRRLGLDADFDTHGNDDTLEY